ncbi:MAG: ABC-type transport auxiliary lipoprotein family protein, partial [Parvularculaceae bacterium]
MKRNTITGAVAALATVISAAGCVSVLPQAAPPSPRYLLTPVAYEGSAAEAVAWSLAVDDPLATRVYDTTKIALVRAPGRIEFYAAGEWADSAPRLVQSALVRSFENSGRILGVGDRGSMIVSDFVLQTDIRALHADYSGGAPEAVFTVYARLTNSRGKVVAGKLFEQKVVANADAVPEIAAS